MTVTNRNNKKSVEEGGTTLPSTMTVQEFAKAMSEFDASAVPPEKLRFAVRAHALRVMASSLTDKALGQDILASRFEALVQAANVPAVHVGLGALRGPH